MGIVAQVAPVEKIKTKTEKENSDAQNHEQTFFDEQFVSETFHSSQITTGIRQVFIEDDFLKEMESVSEERRSGEKVH